MPRLNFDDSLYNRDIKGANLLVNASGVVKLADFGLAKHVSFSYLHYYLVCSGSLNLLLKLKRFAQLLGPSSVHV